MAVTILSNKKNLSAVVHVSAANAAIAVAGNTTTSNIAKGDEVLTGASISKITWGTDGAAVVTISRGSNVAAILNNSGTIDFAGTTGSIGFYPAANVNINFSSANAFAIVELKKIGGGSSEYLTG